MHLGMQGAARTESRSLPGLHAGFRVAHAAARGRDPTRLRAAPADRRKIYGRTLGKIENRRKTIF